MSREGLIHHMMDHDKDLEYNDDQGYLTVDNYKLRDWHYRDHKTPHKQERIGHMHEGMIK